MHNTNLFFILLVTILFSSCNDDTTPEPQIPLGQQNILIVNEGNFGQGNATISLINSEDSLVSNDIIGQANGGITTGDVVQSIYYSNNLIYIISNVENRILVVDTETFVQVGVIESNLENPRYMVIAQDRIFVTNWGSDFVNAFVSVFSQNDLSFMYKIATESGTEKIFTDDAQNFWVSNNFTNTVQVFEFGATTVKQTIKVGNAPNGINALNTEELYVLCQDTFGGTNGYLYKISKQNFIKMDSIPLALKPGGQLEKNGLLANEFVFYSGTSIYSFDPIIGFSSSQNKIADFELELSSIYGIGIDNSGDYWIADHRGFTQNGLVVKTNNANPQIIIERYEVGIGPNSFLFEF